MHHRAPAALSVICGQTTFGVTSAVQTRQRSTFCDSAFIALRTPAQMRLAEFVRNDMEGILADWQAFAATQLPGAAGMKPLELRDHAQKILEAVAKDISQP